MSADLRQERFQHKLNNWTEEVNLVERLDNLRDWVYRVRTQTRNGPEPLSDLLSGGNMRLKLQDFGLLLLTVDKYCRTAR